MMPSSSLVTMPPPVFIRFFAVLDTGLPTLLTCAFHSAFITGDRLASDEPTLVQLPFQVSAQARVHEVIDTICATATWLAIIARFM